VAGPAHASGAATPEVTPEDQRWRELKGRAARWFARLEAEGERHSPVAAVAAAPAVPAVARARA
jgi:hypothetical protein